MVNTVLKQKKLTQGFCQHFL